MSPVPTVATSTPTPAQPPLPALPTPAGSLAVAVPGVPTTVGYPPRGDPAPSQPATWRLVTADSLTVRQQCTESAAAIGWLQAGDIVLVYMRNSGSWGMIDFADKIGCINVSFTESLK